MNPQNEVLIGVYILRCLPIATEVVKTTLVLLQGNEVIASIL